MLRHGDVVIGERIEALPAGAVRLDSRVLAEGEATGHAHRISRYGEIYESGGVLYLSVPEGRECTVSHEEHRTMTVAAGVYPIWQKRQWTMDQLISRVTD